jgi:hypothetical protein
MEVRLSHTAKSLPLSKPVSYMQNYDRTDQQDALLNPIWKPQNEWPGSAGAQQLVTVQMTVIILMILFHYWLEQQGLFDIFTLQT